MAIKTFTTGEVLTSADTNTYLANSGLVYVGTYSFISLATWDCTSAFSATFDHYEAVIECVTAPAGGAIVETRLLSGSTPAAGTYSYYEAGNTWAGAADLTAGGTAAAFMFGLRSASYFFGRMTIFFPFSSAYLTAFVSEGIDSTQSWQSRGQHNPNGSYNGIRFSQAGAMTGKVTIYGYRKA